MKLAKFTLVGILFGIVMTKSEAISWYRIQEMFRFQSFHMYGIIGVAVVVGIIMVALIKKTEAKTQQGTPIVFHDKSFSVPRYLYGGILFGLGWALSGACPGPMYTLVGNGVTVFVAIIASALLGTYCYGLVKDKLPH
ncbi:MAG: transporter [Flavobacteriaceae bacterium]|nr:MAG: transporter [Flavobacteriaceae bacterium]